MQASDEQIRNGTSIQQLGTVLHDMCQPLTALQCRLEMAELMNTDEDYREAVALSMSECARLSGHIQQMRELLRGLSAAASKD